MSKECVFCARPEVSFENKTMLAFKDKSPVTEGHYLVIPKQHRIDFFELTQQEHIDARELLLLLRAELCSKDSSIEGFNIGMNCGEVAGQTVFHCHIHLIPRRKGDMDDPRGGVRGVIPSKQKY